MSGISKWGKGKLGAIMLLSLLLILTGCGQANPTESNQEEGVQVVTTFYPVYDFASQVVGENGTVHLLLDAGQDTHGYEPTPKDLVTIAEADVFVYSSEHMETWVPAVLETLTDTDVLVVEAAEGLDFYENEETEEEHHDHDHEHGEGHSHVIDPHIWLDPVFAKEMVAAIAAGLESVDEENAEQYAENAAAYQEELDQLDQEFHTAFAEASNRTFVVQHAAFGYLARRYELEEVAISSFTSDQEVSPAQMATIGQFIEEHGVSTIYYQDSQSSKLAETLAAETGTELALLSAVEGVTAADQEEGTDYLTLMKDNLGALKQTIR
ncbi:metal ABC transporter solute-binding protein, Zn/Mn family [Jeotgalibaca caeni]|uniref:metal ABC transporter solute-binding protein, Zn/Mn family n=1 Tax=Jeotgalibaca caeni TaxID=3028623 RepID=UPI00237E33F4|nr:zinc ABC transporter substrate-binding protein [Jeotgalibaca caeni]MDE1549325.1 zinc ABC transporter substrate-binding protein [Jeotgalibaca caeni]